MIKVSIDKLYPGFATDELIMVYVFGFERLPLPAVPRLQKPTETGVITADFVNHYSTDIKAAWDVVEEMNKNFTFAINFTGGLWRSMFVPNKTEPPYWFITNNFEYPKPEFTSWEDTAPMAICKSALLAINEVSK